jgi:hypothetical protein
MGSMYAFCDSVINKKPTSPSFDDGAYVQKVLECAYVSYEQGKTVNI